MSTLSTDEHLKGGADRPVFVVSLRPEPGIDPVPALRRARIVGYTRISRLSSNVRYWG